MLDLRDIQGIVFSGYGHMPHSRFLLLQIRDKKQTQAWMPALLPCIVTGERRGKGAPKPKTSVHIAFTAPGLQALGIDNDAISTFPREFIEGISLGERPRVLGDTGESAPENWQFGGPNTSPIHILLALYAISKAEMAGWDQEPWYPATANSGLNVIYQQESFRRTDNEPFGFRDGISQPVIEGGPIPPDPGQPLIAPGEFLLGYLNGYANLSPVPTVTAEWDPTHLLMPDTTTPGRKAFGLNGSFLVLRKLAQDVEGFWKFCETQTRAQNGTPDPAKKVWLASKLVGRWPSGAPLTLRPEQDDPALGADDQHNNNFQFTPTDSAGFACPIGAHMRRTNPRDALAPNAPALAQTITNRHRLMRRGRPYADPLLPSANTPPNAPHAPVAGEAANAGAPHPDPVEQGLIFIAINADIERQFEFVQQTWINSPKFNGLYNDKDPLVADNDATGVFSLQRNPVRQQIQGIPRFVTVRGGGYFFLPGLQALRFLAQLPAIAATTPTPSAPEQQTVSAPAQPVPKPQTETLHPVTPPAAPTQPTDTTEGTEMSTLQEVWASVLSDGHKLHAELLNLRELLDRDLERLLARPGLVRPLFSLLRNIRPIFVAPHLAAVSLYDDVREVLDNEAAFSVVPIYAKKMEATTGDFVLGMDDTPQYQFEIGLMHQAFHTEDLETIRAFVAQCAVEQVNAAAPQGSLDAVSDLSRLVPMRLVGTYFGTPGPDDATAMHWMRTIFREIFLNLGNDPNMAQVAEASARELNAYLDALIAQRKREIAAGDPVRDDFLCRLIQLQATEAMPFADEVIRRIVGGTIVGTVDTNSKAIAQALDQLLNRPLTLKDAQKAARAEDDALLARYVFEALRFNPQNPFLIRRCMQTTTVAQGTPRATVIKEGSLVLVGTESAMFDPAYFPEPDAFRIDRPLENYLHFGHGMHTCFGRYIASVQIPGVLKPLLQRSGLRRAEGLEGTLRYDGAFPDHFCVAFDPD